MNADKLKKLHRAAWLIEMGGTTGLDGAIDLVGEEVANGMLVSFLRRNCKSNPGGSSEYEITLRVDKVLKQEGLLA